MMIELGESYTHETHGNVKVTKIEEQILRVLDGDPIKKMVVSYSYEGVRSLKPGHSRKRIHCTEVLDNFIESLEDEQ